MQDIPLLKTVNLKKSFAIDSSFFAKNKKTLKAVDGINLEIPKGKTLGLVGESGCGKSTLAKLILRLITPTSGEVWIKDQNIYDMSNKALRKARQNVQMVFQDPYASLNPRITAGATIKEPLDIHKIGSKAEREQKVFKIMKLVGLGPEDINKYPHEFSGGQRQRIGIARALVLNPALIIADEPVSSLDVSIQAQIINLLGKLQKKLDLTYLIISHDLAMVRYISDITSVMYLGQIVETAPTKTLFDSPRHPYTEALLSAIPQFISGDEKKRTILKGEVPSPIDPPQGCHFHPRCYLYDQTKNENCLKPQKLTGNNKHLTACHLRVSELS